MDNQMTPSQAARRYADEYGFKIVAVGRRYDIWFEPEGEPRNHVAQVGGYPAALNAMRKWLNDESNPVEMCAGGTLVLPELSADPALTATANNCFGTLEPVTPDTVPMSREEMFAPVKAELDRLKMPTFEVKVATGAELDNWAQFNVQSQARIRKAAARLTRQQRKAEGKPPGGPWHVIFDGSTVMKYGYPSRADALAVVRWGFNHSDPIINNNWRTAAVTVGYRP